MTYRKVLMLPITLFTLLYSVCGISVEPQLTVDEVLERNMRAALGELATGDDRTVDLVIKIIEEDYSLIARYRATSDGAMRIDVFSGNRRVFSEGKDSLGVWEWSGDQDSPSNITHAGVGALEHGIEFNLFALAELENRGHRVELVDREQVRDREYYVLKVTLRDGFETYRFVSSETWLVELARDYRAFHPGVDPSKKHIETRFDNWRAIEGQIRSGRSRNFDVESGALIGTTEVLVSKYNASRVSLDLERGYAPNGPPTFSEN